MITKYRLSFNDFFNTGYLLELKMDYEGSPIDLIGTGNPVVISDVNEGSRKYKPIRGSEMKTRFYMEDISDFEQLSDREIKAILNEKIKDGWQGQCEIDTLAAATSENANPTGSIEITSVGNYNAPTCDIYFKSDNKTNGTYYVYAIPEGEGYNSEDRITLATIEVDLPSPGIDNDDIIDMLVNPDSYNDETTTGKCTINGDGGFTEIPAGESIYSEVSYPIQLRWTQTGNNNDIDTGWSVRQTLNEIYPYIYGNFTSAPLFPLINFVIYDANGNGQIVATYNYIDGETTGSVATVLAASIDGTTIESVLFSDGVSRDIVLAATATGSTIDLEITNLGNEGNITIKTVFSSGMYFLVQDPINHSASYDYTVSGFTGGNNNGEYFRIEWYSQHGWVTLTETTRQQGDTITDILNRLAASNPAIFNLYVENDILYIETTSSNVGFNYRFVTDGNSILIPATSTAMIETTITESIWEGYVLPGLNSYQMVNGKKVVELTATDGLGDLKNINFEVDNNRPFEKLSFLRIITNILNETGLRLRLHEAFNLYEINMDDTLPVISQVYQDTSRLREVSCYDVLEEMLTVMQVVLYQNHGVWETKPLNEYTGYNVNIFQQAQFIESDTKAGNVNTFGGTSVANTFLNADAEMAFEPGLREVILKQNYGFIEQLIKFPKFNAIETYLRQGTVNVGYPWALYFGNNPTIDGMKYVNLDPDYLKFAEYGDNPGAHTLRQTVYMGAVQQKQYSDSKQYELTIKHANVAPFNIYFFRKSSEISLVKEYLYKTSENEYEWSDTEQSIEVPGGEDARPKTFTASFNWDTDDFAESGVGIIAIEQHEDFTLLIESIELKVNTIINRGQRKKSYYDEQQQILSSEKYEEEINLGDVPVANNLGAQAYRNALYYFDESFKLTGLWSKGMPTTPYPIVTLLRRSLLKEYPRAARMITGEILGGARLRDIMTYNGYSYMLTGGEWQVKAARLRGEWQELDMSEYTLIEKQLPYEDSADSSGSTSGIGDITIDLSEYLTENEILALIQGFTETFTGTDITNRQKTIYHNLNRTLEFAVLYKDGVKQSPANFEIDDNDNKDNCIITINIPYTDSTTFEIRVL